MLDLRQKFHSDAISLSGWFRGPELSRLLEGPCHSDRSHNHKRPRCNCYRSGERAPTCTESYPSLGLCLLRMLRSENMYDGVGSRYVPNPPLELENSEKIWNVQFQSWIWKWTAADRNSGFFLPNSEKISGPVIF